MKRMISLRSFGLYRLPLGNNILYHRCPSTMPHTAAIENVAEVLKLSYQIYDVDEGGNKTVIKDVRPLPAHIPQEPAGPIVLNRTIEQSKPDTATNPEQVPMPVTPSEPIVFNRKVDQTARTVDKSTPPATPKDAETKPPVKRGPGRPPKAKPAIPDSKSKS